jgi:hypothetical protein
VADPLGRAVAGTPFRPSASAWNRMLDASRAFDAGAGNPSGLDVPHCLVRVRNDSGGDLPAFSVLALGASILDITVPLRVSPTPMFEGTTPAATSDAFAVLIEPALDGKFALAAIAGVVPVEVNVTDAAHKYATPTASSAARLTSAASGPARILDRVSGTGNKDAVVQLGVGSAMATSAAGARVYHNAAQSVTPSGTYLAYNSERWDTNGFHDTATNNSRLTVPSGLDGTYVVGATARFAVDRYQYARLALHFNRGGTGSTIIAAQSDSGQYVADEPLTGAWLTVHAVWPFAAGEFVEAVAAHSTLTGANVDVQASAGGSDSYGCEFWMTRTGG